MERKKRESRGSQRRPFHGGVFAVAVVTAGLLWQIFVGSSINAHEMYVGAVCVVLTILFISSVARTLGVNLTIRLRDLVQGLRIPGYLVTGNWKITVVLLKDFFHIAPPQNRFRVCGFDSSTDNPVRVARTVMTVAFTTAAPNFIVIGIDPSQSRMLFHQISATDIQTMAKALGAKG